MTILPTSLTLGAALLLALAGCRATEEPAIDEGEAAASASIDEGGTAPPADAAAETPAATGAPTPAAGETAESGARRAPDFTLSDTNGTEHHLGALLEDGRTVVLEWFNPDCPVSKAYHAPARRMAACWAEVEDDGVVWLAINSGAPGKQGSGLERNQKAVQDFKIPYPVLLDESGEVGKAYGAVTTPHMYVIVPDGSIIYEGGIDDSGGRGEASTNYVLQALEDHAAGRPVREPRTRPFGCSVKYAD